ncbi:MULTISPECIES: hypothetical protein [unclassified Pseudomonas]|uniref:hypothetical protein n=1 Tax=unclassified Pseudomonas TaxID=196821 RepID=UPI0019149848|nr:MULTISPECIES: hypothetical protein [unclassified Pseudomonas]MBK5373778.1 hypothetical protein [Pseudomonas sp. TH43]MBK5512545.1 hypothetical protein [Pseudomonas sp. TH15]
MSMKKLTLAVLLAAALAGCGGSKDKAQELVEASGLTKQYGNIVEIAARGYATRYPMLEHEQIRNVVRENLDADDLKDMVVEIYADHFDNDELDLMIRANQHPDQAMAMIITSKSGRDLAQKIMTIQTTIAKDMQEALTDSDEAIIDALDDLKDEAQG